MQFIQQTHIDRRSQELQVTSRQLNIQDSCQVYQETYSKRSKLSLTLSKQQSLLKMQPIKLQSNKSKTESIFLKQKQVFFQQPKNQTNLQNLQNSHDSLTLQQKKISTLVKTAHTIHYLGKSLSKSIQNKRKSPNKPQKQNTSIKNIVDSYHLQSNSVSNSQIQIQNSSIITKNQNDYYFKITSPNKTKIQSIIKHSQHSKDNGKICQIKKRGFIRSLKKQNNSKNNNLFKQTPIIKTASRLKYHQINLQVKSKRQFLQNCIQKPLINSIIISKILDHSQQLQTPILRLKKRLQLNRINCIFQRQTIVSNQFQQIRQSKIQIQQSVIVHRNICQHILPITHKINLFTDGDDQPHKLYLGRQIKSNLLLTVKEIPFEYFQKFTRQLRIYQEIQSHRLSKKNIIELIKHSTDSDKHILLKEPFTQTLNDNLENEVVKKPTELEFSYKVEAILRTLKKTIDLFEIKGMILKRKISLDDFVFVFSCLKFENLQMFELGVNQKLNKQSILKYFRQQVENYYNRISQTSLNF